MAKTVFTGWKTVTPGPCPECGHDDDYTCDGRGNVMCGCQACPECGMVDAYGFHEPDCPVLDGENEEPDCSECSWQAPTCEVCKHDETT